MTSQACPNCQRVHDVGVYVSGQQFHCTCGLHFEVQRTDATFRRIHAQPVMSGGGGSAAGARTGRPSGGEGAVAVGPSLPIEPEGAEHTFISEAKPKLPGYQLEEVLGRGGMGEVWKAVQTSLGRTVAVKILPAHRAKDPEFKARFEKEAAALAALSHPHIIQIIDRGTSGEHLFFAMEYVAGQTLRDRMAQGNLPWPEALSYGLAIGRALQHAHAHGVIHRDLKPENILLDETGHLKVVDFGLAGMSESAPHLNLTASAVAMGTLNYMAPEQRRDAKTVDGRADLYALGVILYELLTSELPLGRFKMPSEKVNGVDPRIDGILAKALEAEPMARTSSAEAMCRSLEEIIGSGTSGKFPALGEGQKGLESGRGTRSLWWGLGVVGSLAALALAAHFLFRAKEDRAETPPPAGNTYGELHASFIESVEAEGRKRLQMDFLEGPETINAHSGLWTLEGGILKAFQAGNETGGLRLVPRAYLAHRYFTADDVTMEVDFSYRSLEDRWKLEPDAQRYAELAFRLKDLQVSIFAIPKVGMRLLWRYLTPDGVEVAGNSARDLEELVEDEMPAPVDGQPVKLRLSLQRMKQGVKVEAFANSSRFAHKVLPGLEGEVGKVALGCRNLACEFRTLRVVGRPVLRAAEHKSVTDR